MNRTVEGVTVKRYRKAGDGEFRLHLRLFVDAYNRGRRLKALRGLRPYEFICQTSTEEPGRLRRDPSHHIPEPTIWRILCTVLHLTLISRIPATTRALTRRESAALCWRGPELAG